ncbi:MAG TPA: enoyl-CoA hydratase-related protein, partial [Acidimicrobiia bacterium]|nr:enoyl-CoA hydratase-related protein [Acidimicrobiia bacterium]
MTDTFIRSERRADDVALVTLDSPPMNALSIALLEQLTGIARELAADTELKAVVITGEGRAFAAGADINEFGDQP